MSEEEIIEEMKSLSPSEEAIQGLLDLYNKEKEKNKELEKENLELYTEIASEVYWASSPAKQIEERYISKDKIKEYLNKMEKRCDKPKFSVMKKEIEKLLEEKNNK